MSIGDRLKKARGDIPQAAVAETTGIKAGTISRYENGRLKPSVDALATLARFYRVDAGWLLTGDEPAIHPQVELRDEYDPISPQMHDFIKQFGDKFQPETIAMLKVHFFARDGRIQVRDIFQAAMDLENLGLQHRKLGPPSQGDE